MLAVFRRLGRGAVQRLVLREREIVASELQTLFVGQVHVDRQRILTLILRMDGSGIEVVAAIKRVVGPIRRGVSFQDAEAARGALGCGDNIAGKGNAGSGVLNCCRLAADEGPRYRHSFSRQYY